MSIRHQVSISGALYRRISDEATRRNITLGDVVDAALYGTWPTGDPRAVEFAASIVPRRVEINVSLGIMELVDDRCQRLRELHGVELSRGELFERAVIGAMEMGGVI